MGLTAAHVTVWLRKSHTCTLQQAKLLLCIL